MWKWLHSGIKQENMCWLNENMNLRFRKRTSEMYAVELKQSIKDHAIAASQNFDDVMHVLHAKSAHSDPHAMQWTSKKGLVWYMDMTNGQKWLLGLPEFDVQ